MAKMSWTQLAFVDLEHDVSHSCICFPLGDKNCWRTVLFLRHDLVSRVSSIYHRQSCSNNRITYIISISKLLLFFQRLNYTKFYLTNYIFYIDSHCSTTNTRCADGNLCKLFYISTCFSLLSYAYFPSKRTIL